MPNVGIVTDSTICLPGDLLNKYGIRFGSVILIIDGKSYRDQVEITPGEFYRRQKEIRGIATTSAVSAADFADIFRDLSKKTDAILCLPLSKALSATYDSAIQAKKMVIAESPEVSIEIIDTKTAAGALGLLVLEAARAANDGKSLAEVTQIAHEMIPKVKFIGTLDTLKYLVRGGRAPKAAGMLGDLIQMKPIIGLVGSNGQVDMLGKVRTKTKAIAKIVEVAKNYIDAGRPVHAIVQYADVIEDGEKLRDLVASAFNCGELYMTELTPVMCCHTGPMIGLAFYSE
jgi:DegV family protein with EDD domain